MKRLISIFSFLMLMSLTAISQNRTFDTISFIQGGQLYKIVLHQDSLLLNNIWYYSYTGSPWASTAGSLVPPYPSGSYCDSSTVQVRKGNLILGDFSADQSQQITFTKDGDEKWRIKNDADNSLLRIDNFTDDRGIYMTTNGVGINTTNPSTALDVAGEIKVSDATINNGYDPLKTDYTSNEIQVDGFIKTPVFSSGIAYNMLLRTEEFENSTWVKSLIGTVTANSAISPSGILTAENIPAGSSSASKLTQSVSNSVMGFFTAGVWIRTQSGTGNVSLAINSNTEQGTPVICNISTNWKFFQVTQNLTIAHTTKNFVITTGTTPISLSMAQMNPGETMLAYSVRTSAALTSYTPGFHANNNPINAVAINATTFTGTLNGASTSSNYSNYGIYLGTTQSSSSGNRGGNWMYIGYTTLTYHASYLKARSQNTRLILSELSSSNTKSPTTTLDRYDVDFRIYLAPHATSTEFNTLIPEMDIIVGGYGKLEPDQIAARVHSSSTSSKVIRLYVRLRPNGLNSNPHYTLTVIDRYGSSYTAANSITNSYCVFTPVASQSPNSPLPAPSQGPVAFGRRVDNPSIELTSTFTCGSDLTVNHVAGTVAPVTKTVSYSTTTLPATPGKCWITRNLGATTQATSATDNTESSAGWYWQFNKKQGYQHNGTTLTPSVWPAFESIQTDWQSVNDPCTIELGKGWRIPNHSEWYNADYYSSWGNRDNTYSSDLKLHAAGRIEYGTGTLAYRGTNGFYFAVQTTDESYGYAYNFDASGAQMSYNRSDQGLSLRCIRAISDSVELRTLNRVKADQPLRLDTNSSRIATISINPDSLSNWRTKQNQGATAYSWGNHASQNYMQDPTGDYGDMIYNNGNGLNSLHTDGIAGLVLRTDVNGGPTWETPSWEPAITKSTGYAKWNGSDWIFANESYSPSGHDHSGTYEPVIGIGTTNQFLRGDKTWQSIPTTWGLNGSDAYYTAGNVGIGVSNPTGFKLYVNGKQYVNHQLDNYSIAFTAQNSSTHGTAISGTAGGIGSTIGVKGNGYYGVKGESIYPNGYGGHFTSTQSGSVGIYAEGSSYSGIFTGNVGINVTNPVNALTVKGTGTALRILNATNTSPTGGGAGFTAIADDGNAMESGHRLGFILLGGAYDNAGNQYNSTGFVAYSAEAWGSTNRGSRLVVEGTANGASSRSAWVTFVGGKAGFGTTNPISTAHIEGALRVTDTARFQGKVYATGLPESDTSKYALVYNKATGEVKAERKVPDVSRLGFDNTVTFIDSMHYARTVFIVITGGDAYLTTDDGFEQGWFDGQIITFVNTSTDNKLVYYMNDLFMIDAAGNQNHLGYGESITMVWDLEAEKWRLISKITQ